MDRLQTITTRLDKTYPLALVIMASIDLEILEAAYEDGAFSKPPNELQNCYYRVSVIRAWEVIDIIQSRAEMGVEGEAIGIESSLNWNTVNIFLRWLVKKNLIEFETPKGDQNQPMQSRIYRIKGK